MLPSLKMNEKEKEKKECVVYKATKNDKTQKDNTELSKC